MSVEQNGRGAQVDFRQLTKRFGRTTAVKGVNLSVARGEFLTILGPSGSGKTTMLRLLAGFDTPTEGAIELDGRDIARLAPASRDIGMVFQNYALFPHMSVEDNIMYGLKMHRWPKADRDRRVQEMLRLVRLEGLGKRRPQHLSGGQQQRVALARALAFGPRVLLMDEPLGALDRALRLEMGEEIRRIHRETGTTVIYVTHDQEEALTLSDRVAIMRNGELVAVDTPEQLYRNPRSKFVATFFGNCNILPAEFVGVSGSAGFVRCMQNELQVDDMDAPYSGQGAVAVHPHHIRVCVGSVEPCEGLVFPASVLDVLFMGDSTQVTCQAEGCPKLTVRDRSVSVGTLRPGDQVMLAIDRDHLILLPPESDER